MNITTKVVSILCTPALLAAALLHVNCARADNVRDTYKTPTAVIPYAWTKPTMDGVVNDDEWRGAASFSALQTTNHAISTRQTRFWMTWDEDNLYLAMRSPTRPGERLQQTMRRRDKDLNVVFDDAYEIFLDVGSHSPDGQPVFFQYLANFAGARYDVMHEPAVGNSRIGWTADWGPKNRIAPNGDWEWEMTVPRRSIFKETPFAEGFEFTSLMARDYKRPWEQNSLEGTSSFSVRDTHSHFKLSKTAPAIHVLQVDDPKQQSLGLALAAFGRSDETLKWSFRSDGGVNKDGELQVRNGQLTTTGPFQSLDKPGDGGYRITVTSADGKTTLFDWAALRKFGDLTAPDAKIDDRGDKVALALEYNPVHDYVRVTGDLVNYDARGAIKSYSVDVLDATGKKLASEAMKLDDLAYVNGVVKLPVLAPGDYMTRLTANNADGSTAFTREVKFTRKDPREFPWWNTKLGDIEKVISPWTPVKYADGKFDVWGRTMRVGSAGLPSQVNAALHNLLAQPMVLVATLADGKTVRSEGAKLQTVFQKDHRTIVNVTSKLGDIDVTSTVTVEFDGMYKVDLNIDPRKAVNITSLKVIVPFQNEVADYIHASGEGIRYGYDYRFLDKTKTGRIWDCHTVEGQPLLVGSFIPYLWIGNPSGGLCWFADSDEGWVPNNDVPAIEVRRDSKASTDLVLNLISSPFSLDKPRKVTFGFEATPVKPMHKAWRMDTWWCGDTFRDYAQVAPKGGSLIFTSLPFTLDKAKSKAMADIQHNSPAGIMGAVDAKKYKANAVAYFEHIAIGSSFVPEMSYFGDEWRTNVSRGLYYGDTFTNFMIYNLGTWAKDCGIDGFYIDNMNPLADDNIDAGRGYRLPDGRIQPTYQMFDTRRYFLRMRAAFAEQGKNNKIVLHMTNNMIIPWVGAADIAYDGEQNVIFPEMGKDFMDFWSLERLRVDYSAQWGTAVNFMHEYQGPFEKPRLDKVMRAYTGMIILHDALPSGNANGWNADCWKAREKFGIAEDDVSFVPYWEPKSGVDSQTKDVYVSAWKRPGKLLLAVVNKGEKGNATVKLDPVTLAIPVAKWKVSDAETGEVLKPTGNTLSVPVERHDYRQIMIETM